MIIPRITERLTSGLTSFLSFDMIARSTGDERWSERYTEYINLCESKLEMTRLNWLPYTSAKLQRTCSHELRE